MTDTAGVQTTMAVIGGKWKASALLHLRGGPTRFNALKRRLPGVTQRTLSQQLRELESDGIVSRTVLEVVPPHVEYALTAKGATLVPILNWLAEWGEAQAPAQPDGAEAPVPVLKREQRQARANLADLGGGGLTAGPTSALASARLAFGAASLTEADG